MKRVLIVGVGALGSHVAMLLRNEAELLLLDFDHVETKNVLSQFHGRQAVGKNKAVALAGLIALVHGVKAFGIPQKLRLDTAIQQCGRRHFGTRDERGNPLYFGPDLVVDATDNAEARRAAQAGARANSIPCLHGGLAAAGAYGMVRWDEDFVISEPDAESATCEDGAFLPFIVDVAARMALAAQMFLRTGAKHGYAVAPDSVTRL